MACNTAPGPASACSPHCERWLLLTATKCLRWMAPVTSESSLFIISLDVYKADLMQLSTHLTESLTHSFPSGKARAGLWWVEPELHIPFQSTRLHLVAKCFLLWGSTRDLSLWGVSSSSVILQVHSEHNPHIQTKRPDPKLLVCTTQSFTLIW